MFLPVEVWVKWLARIFFCSFTRKKMSTLNVQGILFLLFNPSWLWVKEAVARVWHYLECDASLSTTPLLQIPGPRDYVYQPGKVSRWSLGPVTGRESQPGLTSGIWKGEQSYRTESVESDAIFGLIMSQLC